MTAESRSNNKNILETLKKCCLKLCKQSHFENAQSTKKNSQLSEDEKYV